MKTKTGNNKWKEKNQIGEKTRILSASSKIWKTSKYFDKDLRQVVLSAQKIKKVEKEKKETKKKQQQNLTFLGELYEKKKDTESNKKNNKKTTWNQWKRSYQLDWISILCLATDFACLQFRFSLHSRTGCLKLDWAKIFIESFNIKLL